MRRRTSREPDATEALTLLGSAAATLATAESLTGGRLAAVVTAVPGASASYLGGFVTYATALKEALLGVPHELVERYGVVPGERALLVGSDPDLETAGEVLAEAGIGELHGPVATDGEPGTTITRNVHSGPSAEMAHHLRIFAATKIVRPMANHTPVTTTPRSAPSASIAMKIPGYAICIN
mgnify:CR=1 FL=1